eukprot:Gb_01972 [translate_table: standard]
MFFINLTSSFYFSGAISVQLSIDASTMRSMVGASSFDTSSSAYVRSSRWVQVRFMQDLSQMQRLQMMLLEALELLLPFGAEDKVFFTLTMAALGVSQSTSLAPDALKTVALVGESGSVAAEASNAHNFISGLPQGYNTNVRERGVKLFGGQKKCIAISREILKDPRILLLDESTSALDVESERIVQDALDYVMVDRSTIVVAHCLSTIKDADLIAVVKNGVIIE